MDIFIQVETTSILTMLTLAVAILSTAITAEIRIVAGLLLRVFISGSKYVVFIYKEILQCNFH